MAKNYDFVGWATRNDIRCADGRIIRQDAFKECDGKEVPLVWNHQHNSPDNVLGHALLRNVKGGVKAYATFNDTISGQNSKALVANGDIVALSIYANNLTQNGPDVTHGVIREVSLVFAGANPGAYIDTVLTHGEDGDENAAIIYTGEKIAFDDELQHAEEEPEKEEDEKEKKPVANEEKKDKTVKEVFDELTEEQKNVVYALIGQAVQSAKGDKKPADDKADDEGEEKDMRHNLFDENVETQEEKDNVITHSEMMAVISDTKKYGSMKESALQHGIEGIDYLFPEDKSLTPMPPEFINKNVDWVNSVLNGVHHTPFSRVKSMFADIREDEARAKGYIKGKQKKTEVFSLLKRSTSPQTIYKLQKFDRDDVIDITDFDVVSWVKGEMRQKLNEELARAILIGDGRLASDDDHISEDHIRPVYNDANLYTIKRTLTIANNATEDEIARAFERECIKTRKDYRGSGNPTLFTTEDFLTTMLLREDNIGRRIHSTEAELATALRVSKIVTCAEMENMTGALGGSLVGIIVNLADYTVGADKGGAVNLFDDFDIDFNKMAYLIETRCSGALVKPYSAITIELNGTAASSTDYDPTGAKSRGVQVTKGMGDSTVPYPWENQSEEEDDEGGEG